MLEMGEEEKNDAQKLSKNNKTESSMLSIESGGQEGGKTEREQFEKRRSSFFLNRYMSSWVVDMEREKEGYTAGRIKTYCGMATGALTIVLLTIAFLMCFCHIETSLFGNKQLGYGDVVLTSLIATGGEQRNISTFELTTGFIIAGLTLILWFLIYIFDVVNWEGKFLRFLASMFILTGAIMIFVTALLWTNEFPAAPFMAFLGISLMIVAGVKYYIFRDVQKLYYLLSLVVSVFICGFVVLFIFAYFTVADEKYWDLETKAFYYKLLDCPQNASDPTFDELIANPQLLKNFTDNGGGFLICDEAFLVWVSPLVFFGGSFVFAGVLFFLHRAEKQRIASKQAVRFEPMAQVFVLAVMLSLLGLWVAASIASATAALSDTILSLSFQTLIVLVIVTVGIFGPKYVQAVVMKTPIGKKFYDFLSSDWGKGLCVLVFSPLWYIFLFVDWMKQLIRKHTIFGKNITDPAEKKMINTLQVTGLKRQVYNWNFTSVFSKALIWGMLYFTLSVGVTRITVVFLSYLREQLASYSLGVTTLILAGVGLIMFLLPPVPGVPVYITAGIILPFKAEDEGIMSFGAGIGYAIAISLLLKLFALVCQQKLIGEMCGSKSVYIRHQVGINSVEMRALRMVLSKKGWSWGKVVILCGGPDWPTSVLTGIMKLNVFEMLLGTVPVGVLIAPCVVSGAMLVKSSLEANNSFFASVNTVAVFSTVVVQSAAMLAAVQVLATASVKYETELKAEEPDKEVLELENKNKMKVIEYAEVTKWIHLSLFWKFTYGVCVICMIISCYAFQLYGSSLFLPFEITDSIATKLGGNAFYIVTEIGWVFVALFTVPSIYYFVFKRVFSKKAAKALKRTLPEENIDEEVPPAKDKPKEHRDTAETTL